MEPTPGSVLITDENSSGFPALERILSSEYVILNARSGEESFVRAAGDRPDLIVLELNADNDSGFDTLRRLKNSSETAGIPVVVVASLCEGDNENEEKCFALGAVDYIERPFRDSVLKARVRTHIQLLRQYRAVERLVMVDELTGIPNRRRFDDSFATEWKRAIRDKVCLSFMMMDVDKFKDYNDTYGHLQGDKMLKDMAKLLESFARRPGDIIARLGGEEFALLLPAASPDAAAATAENIRAAVEAIRVPAANGTMTGVTISIGLISLTPNQENKPEEFIARADAFLYMAKREGRNRVCFETN